jgi:hypothetical protein
MSKSGPLRTARVGHSLTFVALTCELTPASHRLLNPAAPEAPLCWGGVGEWPIFIIGGERSAGHGERSLFVSRAVSGYVTSELQDPCLPAASI